MEPLNGSLIDPHNGSLTYFDAKPSKELLLSSWILMVTIFGECRRLFSRMSEEFRLSFRRTIASRNEDHLQKGWIVWRLKVEFVLFYKMKERKIL